MVEMDKYLEQIKQLNSEPVYTEPFIEKNCIYFNKGDRPFVIKVNNHTFHLLKDTYKCKVLISINHSFDEIYKILELIK